MIRVFIRYVEHCEGQLLGEFAAEDLAGLVKVAEDYPIYNGFEGVILKFALAHFVIGDEGAYFEIIGEKE